MSTCFSYLRTLSLLLFGTFAITIAAQAQTGLYAEFGASKVDAPSNNWIYGPTFGLYHDFYSVPFLHLGADLRGSLLGVSQTTTLYSGTARPAPLPASSCPARHALRRSPLRIRTL